jgi:SAM-dependent methyltransferase
MSEPIDLTGLDYDFLRYIGVTPIVQRQNQRFYLPFFKDCRQVVDVGCGDGDFVEMLREQGVDACGVDNDPIAVQHLRERQIPVVEADVVTYLKRVEPGSLDGIFSAHLVEHLPYQAVYTLIHYAYHALKPGGRIVLTTPNARALVSHLEMYWLHFGHVAFYHPRLLCFFLHRVGFQNETWGENPAPPHPLSGEPSTGEFLGSDFEIPIHWEAVPTNRALSRWRSAVRVRLARLLGLDDIVRQANNRLRQLAVQTNQSHTEIKRLASVIDRLDRPFECYATAVKN